MQSDIGLFGLLAAFAGEHSQLGKWPWFGSVRARGLPASSPPRSRLQQSNSQQIRNRQTNKILLNYTLYLRNTRVRKGFDKL